MLSLEEIENQLGKVSYVGRCAGCMFCDIDPSLIIAETENMWLIRDKFPIVPGHLMVISKDHYGCMGELPILFFKEIDQLRNQISYRWMISYEHGRAGHCVKMKESQITCHHFHLHILPLNADIRFDLEPRFVPHPMTALVQVPRLFETLGEYLFFEQACGNKLFYPASGKVESHLLRTLVCKAINRNERADWEAL